MKDKLEPLCFKETKRGNQSHKLKDDETRYVSKKDFDYYVNLLEKVNIRLERIEKTVKLDTSTNDKEISDK